MDSDALLATTFGNGPLSSKRIVQNMLKNLSAVSYQLYLSAVRPIVYEKSTFPIIGNVTFFFETSATIIGNPLYIPFRYISAIRNTYFCKKAKYITSLRQMGSYSSFLYTLIFTLFMDQLNIFNIFDIFYKFCTSGYPRTEIFTDN